jgi:ribosomal protein S18 acetylase RimI-like enzyme
VHLTWRPASLDDLDAIMRVYTEMADVDHPDWTETHDEVAEELSLSWVDLALDTRIVLDDERPVAFGQVYCTGTGETALRAYAFGGVVPDYRGRGIGRELLDWQITRARERLDAIDSPLPRQVTAYAPDANTRIPLFEHAGLPAVRYAFRMRRMLAEPIPELDLPAGLRFAEWTPDRDEEAREVKNEAFRDHWGSQPTLAGPWEHLIGGPAGRRDLSVLAVDESGAIVGLVLQEAVTEDWERQGFSSSYLQIIAVLRSWRRQGVAPALMARSLRLSREAGLEAVALDVDAQNPSGALALYEGMGFWVTERDQTHQLEY